MIGSADRRHAAGQLGRFVAVGVTNTAVSYVIYAALIRLSAPYALAGAAGFAAGAVNGYRLNRRSTFGSVDTGTARFRYLVVQLAGLGATALLLALFVGGAQLGRLAGYGLTIPLVTLATFGANRTWTFAPPAGVDLRSCDSSSA